MVESPAEDWSAEDVKTWLNGCGLEKLVDVFEGK